MKLRFLPTFLFFFAILFATLQAPAHSAPRARHVFIISFDGGAPAAMKQSSMPTLFGMARQGAVTWKAQTVRPSITLVSHTSMLTGVLPSKHRISWNDWRPKQGVVKVPTALQLARRAGYTTAFFGGKKKLRHLNIPGTINEFQIPGYSARAVAKAAAKYIVQKKPGLTFIHFADPDGAGHDYGWGSRQQKRAFANTDAALKVLRDAVQRAGIADKSTFILSADHGGHGKTHGTTSPSDMTIPWLAWGAGVRPGFVIKNNVHTCDTAATALWLLGVPVPRDWHGKPVTSAFN